MLRDFCLKWTLLCLLCTALGCESPSAVVPPSDWEKRPNLAATCDFVAPAVGDRAYYWFHLGEPGACRNFVEQDECVLSVYDNCRDGGFQWTGTINADKRVNLKQVYEDEGRMSDSCEGNLDVDVLKAFSGTGNSSSFMSGQLICGSNDNARLYIESVLSETFIREAASSSRVLLSANLAKPIENLIYDAVTIKSGGLSQLWLVYSGISVDRTDTSVEVFTLNQPANTTELRESRQSIAIPKLRNLAWVPTSTSVWASAERNIVRVDIQTHEVSEFATMDGDIVNLSLTPDGKSLYVAWTSTVARQRTHLQHWSLEPEMELKGEYEFIDTFLQKILFPTATSTESPAVIVLGKKIRPTPYVYDYPVQIFKEDLELIDTISNDAKIADLALIDDRQRIGFLQFGHRRYYEMDYEGNLDPDPNSGGDRLFVLPWMKSPVALAYSSEEQRMYIGGFNFAEGASDDAVIGSIDFTTDKVEAEKLVLREVYAGLSFYPLKLRYDSSTATLLPMVTNQAYFFDLQSPW